MKHNWLIIAASGGLRLFTKGAPYGNRDVFAAGSPSGDDLAGQGSQHVGHLLCFSFALSAYQSVLSWSALCAMPLEEIPGVVVGRLRVAHQFEISHLLWASHRFDLNAFDF